MSIKRVYAQNREIFLFLLNLRIDSYFYRYFTPHFLAASRPIEVRSRINSLSNSAIPAKTVKTIFPAGDIVSAQGSDNDLSPAPDSLMVSAISKRSRVERAKQPSLVTMTVSPLRNCSSRRCSSGR